MKNVLNVLIKMLLSVLYVVFLFVSLFFKGFLVIVELIEKIIVALSNAIISIKNNIYVKITGHTDRTNDFNFMSDDV